MHTVGAHFHVPPTWFTPSQLTTGILTNVSYVISNEFDGPDVGFATGFTPDQFSPRTKLILPGNEPYNL